MKRLARPRRIQPRPVVAAPPGAKLLVVIFSFNRAMQLDYFLQSTLERLKTPHQVVVIFHTTGEHAEGYRRLIAKYRSESVVFLERQPLSRSLKERLKGRIQERRRRSTAQAPQDNFKSLLEALLTETSCEFVMFNTDDGFWFGDVEIEEAVFNLIRNSPSATSYRLYVGENLAGIPSYVKTWGNVNLWDYYADTEIHHWSYPFSVDGTVYQTKTVLEALKPVKYHNPVTLEGRGVDYVISRRLFGVGLGPRNSALVLTKLNRVSANSANPTVQIDPSFLNRTYLEGFELHLQLKEPIDNANMVPEEVWLVRGDERILIYTIDAQGLFIQDNLGIEGAKQQIL